MTTAPTERHRNAGATQQRIEDAARALFSQLGYRATTVRRVADEAGVSPNLITRYFGGKDGLFLAATRPALAVDDVYVGSLDGLGRRLARSIVKRWTTQTDEDPLVALLRASGERAEAAENLTRFLDENSTAPLRRYLEHSGLKRGDAMRRAEAVDALILGVTMRRRILAQDIDKPVVFERRLAEAIGDLVIGRVAAPRQPTFLDA